MQRCVKYRLSNESMSDGGQMAERLGNRAINQKVAGSIPDQKNDVSLGKALHPTCLGENAPVLTYWRRASAKNKNTKKIIQCYPHDGAVSLEIFSVPL